MKLTRHLMFVMFVSSLVLCISCQQEELFPAEANLTETIVDNPYVLTADASVNEVNSFLSQMAVKDGDEVNLRSSQAENLSYSVETKDFSVSLESDALGGQRQVQNVPVHILNYKNSCGEEAGYALTVGDKRFAHKVIAFNEKGSMDLSSGADADFWQDMINGYIYHVVNNPESEVDMLKKNEKAVSLRSEPEKVFYQHSMDFYFNWHQSGAPFTDYTPFRNGQRASAGCLPVAMGMVMAWHQWPLQGAYPRYEKDASGKVTLRNVTTNYSGSSFWRYFHPSSWRGELPATDPRIRENIANLLVEIGYKLNASYNSSSDTQAQSLNARTVFRQMGYDCSPNSFVSFNSSTILNDIDCEQPVIISAKRTQTDKEKEQQIPPGGHSYIINAVITQGATNGSGVHIDLKKPLYVYIMNGNAGNGDGWYLEEMFSANKNNFGAYPDGRDNDKTIRVYSYRYYAYMLTNIKPNRNNSGSTAIWRVSDDKSYPFIKKDY